MTKKCKYTKYVKHIYYIDMIRTLWRQEVNDGVYILILCNDTQCIRSCDYPKQRKWVLTLERPYGSFLTHEFGAAVNRCTLCLAVNDCYFCASSIPHLLHCIYLNIISHVAALSAIGIGRVLCSFCRLVCLSVSWKRACILEEWLRQLKCHLG